MFLALSDKKTKEYIRKHTEIFFALSPIVYLTKVEHSLIEKTVDFYKTAKRITESLGAYQVGSMNCKLENPVFNFLQDEMCNIVSFLCDKDHLYLGAKSFSKSGASVKSLLHYAQLIEGGKDDAPIFRPFNYDKDKNIQIYGQDWPQEWVFDDWTTPLNLVVGSEDTLSTKANTDILISRLPKNMNFKKNVVKGWKHSTCLDPEDKSI